MNTVEMLSNVIAEQARKITELEAFIASKMVVSITVAPATPAVGSIAAAHPELPVRDAGRQHAQGSARCIAPSCDTEAAKARAQEAARKAADEGDESDTYHFYDKLISSKGEISLVWNVANSK